MNETNDLIVTMLQEVRAELRELFEGMTKRFDSIDAKLEEIDVFYTRESEMQIGQR